MESVTFVEWRPFCSPSNISCPCMEPDIKGACEEFEEMGTNPRCGHCGWPFRRHREAGPPREEESA